jgi:hypothetical protein
MPMGKNRQPQEKPPPKKPAEAETTEPGDFEIRWLQPPFGELTVPPPAGRDGVASGTSSYDALPGELLPGESSEEPEDG